MSLRLCSHSWKIPRNAVSFAFSQFCVSRPNLSVCRSLSGIHYFSMPVSYRSASNSAHSGLQAIGRGREVLKTSSPLSGLEDILAGYITGKRKATEVAHSVWKYVVQKGDTVIDATCGNGHDTLAMVNLVKDDSGRGRIYGFDIQEDAVNNTSSLLDMSLRPMERNFVKLYATCHSKMMEVLPTGILVRLVAFNLGYLPGGDKEIITRSNTTLLALEAAKEVLISGGLISAVVYVGHPGGWEEFETVQKFASGLSAEEWACTQIQMLNRPSAPILIFLFKRGGSLYEDLKSGINAIASLLRGLTLKGFGCGFIFNRVPLNSQTSHASLRKWLRVTTGVSDCIGLISSSPLELDGTAQRRCLPFLAQCNQGKDIGPDIPLRK